jgi:hypothetical protein
MMQNSPTWRLQQKIEMEKWELYKSRIIKVRAKTFIQIGDAKFVRLHIGNETTEQDSKDPMEKLARIAKKTDRITLYILQILHTLLAGCNILSLVLLPIGDLGDPHAATNTTSIIDTNVRIDGAVFPISSDGSVQIPSQTQVYSPLLFIKRCFLHFMDRVLKELAGFSIAWPQLRC